jgi:F5/8 type C domain
MTRRGLAGVGSVLAAIGIGCGGAPPPATPTSGAVAVVEARDIGKVEPTNCSTAGFIALAGTSCREVRSKNATGGAQHVQAATANDGDACTIWNAGGVPPQAITVDLEKDVPVTGLLLVPDMTPPEGDVTHTLEQSSDGDTWTAIAVVKRRMTDDHVYAVTFPNKVTARFLRVSTTASVSWVAWAEVAPLFCN